VFGLFASWASHPAAYPFGWIPAGPVGAIAVGIPGALAISGLVEFITGRSITDLERTWASQGALKKLLLGTLLVIFGGLAIIGVVIVAFK
jgi:hypothetical protein